MSARSPRVTLMDAVAALDDRKNALPEHAEEVALDSDEARFMVLGFDVNIVELSKLGQHVGRFTAKRTQDPADAAEAAWMDGVLSGLMLAELRRAKP